jgi:hypothetical protein
MPAGRIEPDAPAMTDTSHRRSQSPASAAPQPTAWAGWVVFAGVMLMMLGTFQVIQGLVALFDDGFYLVRPNGLVVDINYNTWGWIHLLIGVVAILAGLGLLSGNMVARVVGVVAASFSALVNWAFVSAYPIWSIIMITIDVIVIYAIIAHGRELKDLYR